MATLESAIILPSSPSPMRVEPLYLAATDVSRNPFSFAMRKFDWGGRIRTYAVTMPVMPRRLGESWVCRMIEAIDANKPVSCWADPLSIDQLGAWGGTPLVHGAQDVGERTIVIDGLPTNQEETAIAGDHISIENIAYKILNDADSDGAGKVYLDIFGGLRVAIADNAPVVADNPQALYLVDSFQHSISGRQFYSISFNLVEYRTE